MVRASERNARIRIEKDKQIIESLLYSKERTIEDLPDCSFHINTDEFDRRGLRALSKI